MTLHLPQIHRRHHGGRHAENGDEIQAWLWTLRPLPPLATARTWATAWVSSLLAAARGYPGIITVCGECRRPLNARPPCIHAELNVFERQLDAEQGGWPGAVIPPGAVLPVTEPPLDPLPVQRAPRAVPDVLPAIVLREPGPAELADLAARWRDTVVTPLPDELAARREDKAWVDSVLAEIHADTRQYIAEVDAMPAPDDWTQLALGIAA